MAHKKQNHHHNRSPNLPPPSPPVNPHFFHPNYNHNYNYDYNYNYNYNNDNYPSMHNYLGTFHPQNPNLFPLQNQQPNTYRNLTNVSIQKKSHISTGTDKIPVESVQSDILAHRDKITVPSVQSDVLASCDKISVQSDILASCDKIPVQSVQSDILTTDANVAASCDKILLQSVQSDIPAHDCKIPVQSVQSVVERVECNTVDVEVDVVVKTVDHRGRILARIEAAVERVLSDMVDAGEDVYVWNVARLVLIRLEADSWVSLGFGFKEVPSLCRLIVAETKCVKDSVGTFISTWKEACMMYTTAVLFEKLLDFYLVKKARRAVLISSIKQSPLLGLLNVAVISIQRGTWDSLSNTFQFNCETVKNVDSIRKFARTWKEACLELTAAEVFEKMLEVSELENNKRSKLRLIFSTMPLAGFLDVAVTSIKSGVWDRLYERFHSGGKLGPVITQDDEPTVCRSPDVGCIKKVSVVPSEGLLCHTDEFVPVPLEGPKADVFEKVVTYQQAQHDFNELDAAHVVELIRREEFGLYPNISDLDSRMLKKQHARLLRALYCLSQELYSQDSRFLLELVQNADDNLYHENVEPTLTFILQATSIGILNNERGFTAENMRALCDIGNSTKKGASSGHIGQKGIGFKSVFRVTDTPEIHSNGFHVKFDTTEDQLGFILPTIVSPCDFDMFQIPAVEGDAPKGSNTENTCILLPFKRELLKGSSLSTVSSMFSDLHPSVLLFLRRLQCIKLRNMLDDTYILMRKEIVGDGIVEVSHGKEKMTWFVTSTKLHPETNSSNGIVTEISIALTLKEAENGVYGPILQHQPVFAFLPLRTYGLKFILHADFVLTSSREEVDKDSPWNQWLLAEFPDLFVNAEKSFCSLSCFHENPAQAISVFMSFVPFIGEGQGFFSELPRMIISKLSQVNCLLEDGFKDKWVPPCKVLKGWNEQAQTLLPSNLLSDHLGLGFLHKDIDLPERLAIDLGIQEYGPETVIQFIVSLGHIKDGIKSLGLGWLFSWLNELHSMVLAYTPNSKNLGLELDLIKLLKKVPFIPLSDGTYSSLDEGTIWLHDNVSTPGLEEFCSEAFPCLYATLRTVTPALFSHSTRVDMKFNCMKMLENIGLHLMSAHTLVRIHILPSLSNGRVTNTDDQLMHEYIAFIMFHLQSNCMDCHNETDYIFSALRSKAVILTNYGYKRLDEVPIHFSREFGNFVDASKFLHGLDYKWHEIDAIYLRKWINESMSCGLSHWREFFKKLGVTDFVKVVPSEKSVSIISPAMLNQMICNKVPISQGLSVEDWESPELVDILYLLSKEGSRQRCEYFLNILDVLWDDHYSDKAIGFYGSIADRNRLFFKSKLVTCISDVKWIASNVDIKLHLPGELFYDCDAVQSILGCHAHYAVPKIGSKKLLAEIGFKTEVTLDDALTTLQSWRSLKSPFMASLSQMCNFYSFICKEMVVSRHQVLDVFRSGPFIFVPSASVKLQEDVAAGVLLSPEDVYWHDSTGSVDHIKDVDVSVQQNSIYSIEENKKTLVGNCSIHLTKTLCSLYPNLYNFFVTECSVNKAPSFHQYLQIVKQLSKIPLSQEVAKAVFRIFLWWSFCLECGTLFSDEIVDLKSCISHFSVLPAVQNKWVSANPSVGLVCWCCEDNLTQDFEHSDGLAFLYFGELTNNEREMLRTRVSILLQKLEIHSLSEIVSRKAMCHGPTDSGVKTSISMLKRMLPFALRYLYNLHPESYNQHKLSEFSKLRDLRIILVEKLFYQNVINIKNTCCASKKQHECSSLLQANILYKTKDSDPHSVFMELSRLLFNGTPDLHLANFLHMVTLMGASGSTDEQIELFIVNNQKMVKLPNEELFSWCINDHISSKPEENLTSSSSLAIVLKAKTGIETQAFTIQTGSLSTTNVVFKANATSINGQISRRSKGKSTNSRARPAVWKQKKGTKTQVIISNQNANSSTTDDVSEALPKVNGILETFLPTNYQRSLSVNKGSVETFEDLTQLNVGAVDDSYDIILDSLNLEDNPLKISEKTRLLQNTSTSQEAEKAKETGRQGEEVAFQYFADKSNGVVVNWVNREKETGLPYDILVGEEDCKEYIEVKASRNARKDWFQITRKEWEFATLNGDSFSVAHVILFGQNLGKLTVYKNPVKLCQTGVLQRIPFSKCHFIRPNIIIPI